MSSKLLRGAFCLVAVIAQATVALAQPADQDFQSASTGAQGPNAASNSVTIDGLTYSATYNGNDRIFIHPSDIGITLSPNFLSFASGLGQATNTRIETADGSEFTLNRIDLDLGNCGGCSGTYQIRPLRNGVLIPQGVFLFQWDSTANTTFSFRPSLTPASEAFKNVDAIEIRRATAGTAFVAIDNLEFAAAAPTEYTIGGTVTGLSTGNFIGVQNGSERLSLVEGNTIPTGGTGPFTFTTKAVFGDPYAVKIFAFPIGSNCTLTNGSGTVTTSNITNVQVDCGPKSYQIGGSVTGLSPGTSVVLQNNGGDNLTVAANGAFQFSTPITFQDPYAVTVLTQPAGETCVVTNGSGSTPGANVTNIGVTCTLDPTYEVGGTVSGLAAGAGILLTNNGVDVLPVSSNGAFSFSNELADGSSYAVAVNGQPVDSQGDPVGQQCTVSNGSGTIAGADISNATVTCTNTIYRLGGLVTGLDFGDVVQLDNNSGISPETLAVVGGAGSSGEPFTFASNLTFGVAYNVAIASDPTGKTCSVTSGAGTMPAGNVNNVSITCVQDTYTIGGQVSGLASGNSVTLRLNGAKDQTLNGNVPFVFTPIADGTAYTVSIASQPDGQTCAVANGSGTLAGAAVSNVAVTCTSNSYTIGGQVSGLASGTSAVLQNNGGDNLTLGANGAFSFATAVPFQGSYSVSVLTQPSAPSETCTVSGGSGTVPSQNVTSVNVTCAVNTFTVGGTVSGLAAGQTIELSNNGANPTQLSGNGSFQFPPKADGTAYSVSVSAQPTGQTCSVVNGTGTLAGSNVTNVTVSCANDAYTLGGSLSGLAAGTSLVLQNNGADNLSLATNGPFTFPATLTFGQAYSASVLTQPGAPSETCSVTNGSGTMPAGNVNTVSVSCSLNPFPVSGTVTGLAGGGQLTLRLNGADDQLVTSDGPFAFSPIADGTAYTVSIASQPDGQTCAVANGSGTLAGAAVSNVAVTCTSNSYTIGGQVSGLASGTSAVLQNNGGDNLTLGANGAFSFATAVPFQGSYSVSVLTQPSAPSETCVVSNGAGLTPANDVTSVSVVCSTDSFTVGGTITGLQPGQTVELQNNGADTRTFGSDGNFTFSPLADTSPYAVTIATQPASQFCEVQSGTGTLAGADVTSVQVSCSQLNRSFTGTLPSGNTGSLSFTTGDSACTFRGSPTFSVAPTPAPPAGLTLFDGVVGFVIEDCAPGATVTVTLDYGVGVPPNVGYWKVGSPWRQMSAAVSGTAVTFSITDGGGFDDDNMVNGVIVDPSGAASGSVSAANSPVNVPATPWWSLAILMLLILQIASMRHRARV